jgi:PQQ-like domain
MIPESTPCPASTTRLFNCVRWRRITLTLTTLLVVTPILLAQHRVVLQGNHRLAILGHQGDIEWEMPWEGIHDLHVLENGNFMLQQGKDRVVEIDRRTKRVVWSYDSATMNGNQGQEVEVHAFQPLDSGHVMIAESGPGRMIEIERDGKLVKSFDLKLNHPQPHRDTRLARRLNNGYYLVCHEGDGIVREYDPKGKVVWNYEVPLFGHERADGHGPEAFGNSVFSAVRLSNGNTLIATGNGHSVLEVTPDMTIIWHLRQRDLAGIVLAWVTTLEVLPNGNYLIGNCHAGPENPVLIEIEPKTKQVVWSLDAYDRFGNDVSTTKVLD